MTRIRHTSHRLDYFYLCVERARRKSTSTLNPLRRRAAGAHPRVTTDVRNYRADLIAGLMAAGVASQDCCKYVLGAVRATA
jgi:hypothetical protein